MGKPAELGKLTPREAHFLLAHIRGEKLGPAYLSICRPKKDGSAISEENARKMGSRMLARIEQKIDLPRLLNSAGLGITRFAAELEKRYSAMEMHFYQGMIVAVCEDNGTRMRATELHARILGIDKSKVELSGKDGGPIQVQIIDDIPASPSK